MKNTYFFLLLLLNATIACGYAHDGYVAQEPPSLDAYVQLTKQHVSMLVAKIKNLFLRADSQNANRIDIQDAPKQPQPEPTSTISEPTIKKQNRQSNIGYFIRMAPADFRRFTHLQKKFIFTETTSNRQLNRKSIKPKEPVTRINLAQLPTTIIEPKPLFPEQLPIEPKDDISGVMRATLKNVTPRLAQRINAAEQKYYKKAHGTSLKGAYLVPGKPETKIENDIAFNVSSSFSFVDSETGEELKKKNDPQDFTYQKYRTREMLESVNPNLKTLGRKIDRMKERYEALKKQM